MINSNGTLNEWVQLERALWIKRNYPNGAPKRVRSKELLFQSALRHVEFYMMQTGFCKLKGVYWKLVYRFLSIVCNVMIPPNVFEKGLLIVHLQNIVISTDCRVGKYCCLFHGTTIGISLRCNENGACPKLGDGITVCAGAGVFGDIQIEDGVTIAANAVVIKSVKKKGVVVGGVPAQIISKNVGWSMIEFVNRFYGEVKG